MTVECKTTISFRKVDLDFEMKIWISGANFPVKKEFKRGIDVADVQRTLAKYILRC